VSDLVVITVASGGIGGRVARRLAGHVPLRLVVRDPARAPDVSAAEVAHASYHDPEALRRAFDGAGTVLFVSANEDADREGLHRNVVDALSATGVEHVVYTSFVNTAADATFTFSRDHWQTEQLVRAAGLRHTFLRDGLYMDFLPQMADANGVIRGPGDGWFAPIARDDLAEVASLVLGEPTRHEGRTYTLTGSERVTLTEVAGRLTALTGRPVTFYKETIEEAYASREHYGAPAFEVEGWVTTYIALAKGEMDVVTDDVRTLTGHDPMSLDDYLRPAAS
jgi:NAD(P)H dehydrogenase (quinone)